MAVWAYPDTPEKQALVEEVIEQLDRLKERLYYVAGDDELFEHLDGAIIRLEQLLEEMVKG